MDTVEVDGLKELYRRERDAEVRERILIIIWLKSGKSSYDIGSLLFCPHSKVMYWKKRYEESGVDSLRTVDRPGRPRLMTSTTEDEIRKELSGRDYWKSTQIATIVKEKGGVKYTQRHIRRLMQKWGYSLITPRRKHRDSASPEEVADFKKKQQRYWALSGRE
jgi:transposase